MAEKKPAKTTKITKETAAKAVKEKGGEVGKKLLTYLDKGVEASQKGLKSAGKAITDFGDKSVLRIELRQLKTKETKAFAELGKILYARLSSSKTASVSADDEELSTILKDVAAVQKNIKKHENSLKTSKKASEKKAGSETKKTGGAKKTKAASKGTRTSRAKKSETAENS